MPGYIVKQLQHYKHNSLSCPQHCPYYPQPKQYGSSAQRPIPPNMSPPLSNDNIKYIQRVIVSILFYARAVDLTMLMALSSIVSEQSKGTDSTMKKCKQLLDYLASHPNASIHCHSSNMILNIHFDALYLSKLNAHSCACRHFFMGWKQDPIKPIKLNNTFFSLCAILRFISASTAKAKLGASFLNCKQATIFWLTLQEMSHLKPPTPINGNNSTAVGIANNTVKRQRSRSMEMQFFWVADAVAPKKFDIKYFPGRENLADYQSKHHTGTHHVVVCPWYLHKPKFVFKLPRACKPSTLKGCVGTCSRPSGPKPEIQHNQRGRGMPTLTWEEVTIREGKRRCCSYTKKEILSLRLKVKVIFSLQARSMYIM